MLNIDEVIELLKNGGYLTNREEGQISEWLEELKAIKSDGFTDDLLNMGFTKGYNKAIDDFKSRLEERILAGKMIDEKFAYIDNCDIDEIVEQLKAGGENEI